MAKTNNESDTKENIAPIQTPKKKLVPDALSEFDDVDMTSPSAITPEEFKVLTKGCFPEKSKSYEEIFEEEIQKALNSPEWKETAAKIRKDLDL